MGAEGTFHRSVMVEEVLAHLEPAGDGEIMDGTVGGGGHSQALLVRYPACRVVAVDRDPIALEVARMALQEYQDRVSFIEARFDEAAAEVGAQGPRLSGALLDLGMSTHQLDVDERGFSFRPEVTLDMRMAGGVRGEPTAADLLNNLDEARVGQGLPRVWGGAAVAAVGTSRCSTEGRSTLPRGGRPDRSDGKGLPTLPDRQGQSEGLPGAQGLSQSGNRCTPRRATSSTGSAFSRRCHHRHLLRIADRSSREADVQRVEPGVHLSSGTADLCLPRRAPGRSRGWEGCPPLG